jgi:hypothetical protein
MKNVKIGGKTYRQDSTGQWFVWTNEGTLLNCWGWLETTAPVTPALPKGAAMGRGDFVRHDDGRLGVVRFVHPNDPKHPHAARRVAHVAFSNRTKVDTWADELSVLSLPLYGPEWSALFLADLADVNDRAGEG